MRLHAPLLATALLALPAAGGAQDATALELADFTPRSWSARGAYATDLAAARRRRGVLPVANGRVFAHVGYGEEASRMFMITGPHYQTRRNHEPHGAFGQLWLELHGDDGPLTSRARRWTDVVRAAAARTREEFEPGDVLETVDFAHAELPVIVRRVRVVPAAGTSRRVVVRCDARPDGAPTGTGAEDAPAEGVVGLRKTYQHGDAAWRLLVLPRGSDARVDGDRLVVDGIDAELTFTLLLLTSRDANRERALLEQLLAADPADLQREALAGWREQLAETVTVQPQGPLRQHLESVKKLVLSQRSAPGGGVAPMVNFKGVWARDSNGPLRTFLWMGRFDLAHDLLTYYRRASALRGHTHREYPLDLDLSAAPELTPQQWAETGTDRCEVPSYIALQHAWYLDHTLDTELLRTAWPYVLRNARHQESTPGPHGPLQRFNGDETYLHGAFYSLWPQKGVWPNDLPRVSAWSLDSLLAWDRALNETARLARALGDEAVVADLDTQRAAVRASVEQSFWMPEAGRYAPALSPLTHAPHPAPFAPINLRPLWLGTHTADDPRALSNLSSTLDLLLRPDGLLDSTPSVDWFIGTQPGYLLANLAAVDHPLGWQIVDEVLDSASPSGAWAEVHEADGVSWGYGDGTLPNRYRPWESGLVMDAVLRFLTGMQPSFGDGVRLAPRRPADLDVQRVGPLRIGDTRFAIEYPPAGRDEPARVVHLRGPALQVNAKTLDAGATLEVPLRRPRPQPFPRAPRPYSTAPELPAGERLVVTTLHEPEPEAGDVFLDAGLPFRPRDLAAALFDAAGARRYDVLVIEPWARRADRETMKPRDFWDAPILRAAREQFIRLGGRVEMPTLQTDWLICGPFPNPDSRGLFEEQRPLEQPFDAEATFPVEGQEADARWFPRTTPDGRLDLHLPVGPQDEVCVFARTVITSEAEREATLLLGTDDGCRVWLNGELVFESIEHRHLTPDQFRIPIELKAGDNVLIVGVEDRAGGFGLAARIR